MDTVTVVFMSLLFVWCLISVHTTEAQIKTSVYNFNSSIKIRCNSKADIVFLLDTSSSVGDEDFEKVISFIVNLLEDADIDQNEDIRVGLLTFSTDVTISFHLGQHKTKQDLITEIMNTTYNQGSTNTADALLAMRTEMFNTANGDRKRVPNMAIVITDGISNLNSDRTVTEAIRANAAGIHIFAIGIGFTGRTPELRLMVTPPVEENLFLLETFGALDDMRKAMFSRICEMSVLKSSTKTPSLQLPAPSEDDSTCEHAFDITFIVSIRKTENRHVRSFLKKIIDSFDTGTNLAQVAVVKGQTKMDTLFFKQLITKKEVIKYFENDNSISKTDTIGELPSLLRYARNHIFQSHNGDREDIPNIAVVIADEIQPSSLKNIRRESRKLKSTGTHVILLSTGYRGRKKSLNSISTKPYNENKIMVRNVRKLQVLANSLGRHICKVARKNLLATTHSDYIRIPEEDIPRITQQWNFTELSDTCLGVADIIFVLDSSGSVGQSNFKIELDFVKNFSSYLNISPTGHRVALMSFSDNERVHIWLNATQNIHTLSEKIDKVRYHYGSTNLLSAIHRINTDVLDHTKLQENPVREKVVFLITDGSSNVRNAGDIVLESTRLKQKAVTIIGIAVNIRYTDELETVVSLPYNMFIHKVPSFRELHGLIPELVPPLCHGIDYCQNTECMSDGKCINLMNRYRCHCMPGYTGVHCQLNCTRPTDIAFLLDSSASIREENFEHIKSLTKGVISHLNKYSCDYQIAAMKYGSTAIPQFYFNDYRNISTLLNAIDGISFSFGYTNTAEAIRVARKTFFTEERGDRLHARDVMMIITDGLDNIRSRKLFEEARNTHGRDIAIVPIGINLKDKTSINFLASTSDGLFFVDKFEELENMTETVVDYMVKSEDMCQYNPCQNSGLCQPTSTSFKCSCSFGWNGDLCQSRCSPEVNVLFGIDTSGHMSWDKFYIIKEIFQDIFSGLQKLDKKTPIGIVSVSSKIRTILPITPNLTYPLAVEIFNEIRLHGDTSLDMEMAPKFQVIFPDGTKRDKTLIFIGSNKTIQDLPIHNIVGVGVDILVMTVGDSDRVITQFIPRYPYNELNERIVTKTKDSAEQVISLLCDSRNECLARPCGLRGHCVDGRKSYSCTCFNGYSGPKCERGCPVKADVAFLLDSSGSVGRRNFLKVQEFVSQVVSELSIGESGSKVSVTTFSTRAKVAFPLAEYSTKEDIIDAVMNTRYHYGDTNTADGLEMLRNDVFTLVYGNRPHVQDIAILVTDGMSNVRSFATLTEAEMTKDEGIHIFTIGIGLHDVSEVTAMASYPQHQNTFVIDDFDHLISIVDDLVSLICEDADICENNPCLNDGKCEDHVNAFTCHCPSGYSGPLCATSCLSEVDLVFIIDTSTSVGEINFKRSLDFVKNITSVLEIDHGNVRVALITFSDYVNVWFNLDTYHKKSDILHHLETVEYYNGAAFTSEALRIMRQEVFTAGKGDRPAILNHCILITDGVSNILPQKTAEEAIKLHHFGVKVTAIGIGLKDNEEIVQIASNKENLFNIDSYFELNTLVEPVLDIVCSRTQGDTQTLVQYIDSSDIQSDVYRTEEMKPLDVAFVVDSSSSVGRYNFSKILSFIEYFIELLYSRDVKYAVLTCSNPVRDHFYFQNNYQSNELRKIIMNIPYKGGQLDLPSALERLDKIIFSTKYGDRINASDIGILIIDGFTNDLRSSVTFAKQCRAKGVILYIVTIAIRDISMFYQLTGSHDQVIKLETYNDLLGAAKKLSDTFVYTYSTTTK